MDFLARTMLCLAQPNLATALIALTCTQGLLEQALVALHDASLAIEAVHRPDSCKGLSGHAVALCTRQGFPQLHIFWACTTAAAVC